jgi:hypothetical protein
MDFRWISSKLEAYVVISAKRGGNEMHKINLCYEVSDRDVS